MTYLTWKEEVLEIPILEVAVMVNLVKLDEAWINWEMHLSRICEDVSWKEQSKKRDSLPVYLVCPDNDSDTRCCVCVCGGIMTFFLLCIFIYCCWSYLPHCVCQYLIYWMSPWNLASVHWEIFIPFNFTIC